jgi:glycosyltransferase involved in cell wall biosynthesis
VRAAEDCPYRRDVLDAGSRETALCLVLSGAFGDGDGPLARVRRDACEACCAEPCAAPDRGNRVLASLIYRRALLRSASSPGVDPGLADRLKAEARWRLAHASNTICTLPGGLGVLGPGQRRLPGALPNGRRLSWVVAVLTAPRPRPTLAGTLESLGRAGFGDVQIFAEPRAPIPAAFADLPIHRHRHRLGPLRNFGFAARRLLEAHPGADCYAIFEDDLSAAAGLLDWCDREFWPGDHGIVSLYTSRVMCDDRPGWQTLNLGRYRTFGALAFVFRGPVLRGLLDDPDVLRHVNRGMPGADAVVGEWALRRGVGIAYHSPSLVQHEGEATSLEGHRSGRVGRSCAVDRVEDIGRWRGPDRRPGRVGLIGWNTPTGLGYQNRDIALHLPVTRWLAPPRRGMAGLPPPRIPGEFWASWSRQVSRRALRSWLGGLDWLLFVEHPFVDGTVQLAREMGISVACVPNWEWLGVGLDWLPYVDLMICPTRSTERMLLDWRRDLGFSWDVVHAPWPVDPHRFEYRRRERCRRFLFVNGTGGGPARRVDGTATGYRRKGGELIAATAGLMKDVPFVVYSQDRGLPAMPPNVEVRRAPRDNRDLYRDGDVCVQPSHWEGLGLQHLECQAAGLPLVTTDAPPMNECRPFRAVPAAETELVFLNGDQPVDAHLVHPDALAEVLLDLVGRDIGEASEQARGYIEQERSWRIYREVMASWLTA